MRLRFRAIQDCTRDVTRLSGLLNKSIQTKNYWYAEGAEPTTGLSTPDLVILPVHRSTGRTEVRLLALGAAHVHVVLPAVPAEIVCTPAPFK